MNEENLYSDKVFSSLLLLIVIELRSWMMGKKRRKKMKSFLLPIEITKTTTATTIAGTK
jgi:hypothetical protein